MRMKSVLSLLVLMGLAVAVGMLMGANRAMVTVFWSPYRIDLSFNLALTLWLTLMVLVLLAYKANTVVRQLPVQAKQWRAQQTERALQQALFDAMAHWLAGRFVRAQKSAQQAMRLVEQVAPDTSHNPDQRWAMVHWMGAETAHALGQAALRDQLLAQIVTKLNPKDQSATLEGIRLRAAYWALQDRQPAVAQSHLEGLPQGVLRRIQALRLRLKLARQSRQHPQALDLVRQLVKAKAYSPDVATMVVRSLLGDGLRQAHDPSQLVQVWKKLGSVDQARPELMQAYLQRLYALKQPDAPEWDDLVTRAVKTVMQAIELHWQSWHDAAQEDLIVALTPLIWIYRYVNLF